MAKHELVVTNDSKVLGVAGGIAQYYQADPAWVRILAVIFIIASGVIPGLIIYFVLGRAIMQPAQKKK